MATSDLGQAWPGSSTVFEENSKRLNLLHTSSPGVLLLHSLVSFVLEDCFMSSRRWCWLWWFDRQRERLGPFMCQASNFFGHLSQLLVALPPSIQYYTRAREISHHARWVSRICLRGLWKCLQGWCDDNERATNHTFIRSPILGNTQRCLSLKTKPCRRLPYIRTLFAQSPWIKYPLMPITFG